jgi:hypothetical protein
MKTKEEENNVIVVLINTFSFPHESTIKTMRISNIALCALPLASAFAPHSSSPKMEKGSSLMAAEIYDPLGLYPSNSPERAAGLIKPLENVVPPDRTIFDPLSLYQDKTKVSNTDMSASLPFLPRPVLLDGTLPGDRGFDPFNFSSDTDALQWYRKSEIKHARLAMLAVVGWPLSEIFHKDIASALDLPAMLASHDRVPSVLNDGLSHASSPLFWIAAIAAGAILEIQESVNENTFCKLNPGDAGFDPLNLGGKNEEQEHFMQEAEIFNGRLGMLAITGFAIQEWFLNSAVVDQIPILFKPLNVALEQMVDAGAMSI